VENYAPNAWAEIISKAAISPLGIAALVSLIVGFVVLALVPRSDKPAVRVAVLVLLMVFCGGLMGAAVYGARPIAPSVAVAAGATTAGASGTRSAPTTQASGQSTLPTPTPEAPTTASATPQVQPPPPPAVATRTDCGAYWTGWIEVGNAVGSPCPQGCSRGAELGQSYRAVGFPPRPQTQHKFQCWRP